MVRITEIDVPTEMKRSDYIFKNNDWYKYRGGRKQFQKSLQAERVSQINLTETKEVANIWKIHNFLASSTELVLLEQCVWLSLCIEWNETAKIFFNYDKNQITCSGMGMEIVI